MKTIYLCGPIKDCTDDECITWRQEAKALWHGKCLDPMMRDYRNVEVSVKEVVEPDKQDIDNSDILLVYYTMPSVGTSMEVLYAFERNKKILIINPYKIKLSPWLVYHSHGIFTTLKEAIDHLKGENK